MDAVLDAKLIAFMDEYEQYQALQRELQNLTSEGFLQLAQARKSTGVAGVSKLQYPQETVASSRVAIDPLDEDICLDQTKPEKDPLRWFGVLVPSALRQAQTTFRRSTEIAVRLADSKVKMQRLESEFKSLRANKDACKIES
eukprot:TRINITY_DN5096_c0_g1_i1.p1 TRINITY_DN5096_c0_g1~~TRINITY_DN5096_c0_g1_i1.p1  ORF type:complete len:161 (+),score=18.41 TRINITY_DN5096_c0_g1_i1:58-483(+)